MKNNLRSSFLQHKFIQPLVTCKNGHFIWIRPKSGRMEIRTVVFWLSTWASLVAQMVKHPPAMRSLQWGRLGFRSLGWEDPLEEGMATYWGCKESDTTEWLSTAQIIDRVLFSLQYTVYWLWFRLQNYSLSK